MSADKQKRKWRKKPGALASGPTKLPWKGWLAALKRTFFAVQRDKVLLMAAGVAFYGFLSFVPILIASLSIYGLVADPSLVNEHFSVLLTLVPGEGAKIVNSQLTAISTQENPILGITTIVSLLVALWSGSAGVNALVESINSAYGEKETRSFIKLRLLSIVFTFGFLFFGFLSLTVLAAIPSFLSFIGLEIPNPAVLDWGRWLILAVLIGLWSSFVYRYGPDRENANWKWLAPGAIASTLLWLLASGLLSFYVEHVGKIGATYGSLGGVVAFQLWLFVSALAFIVGAEINSELEHQTLKDSTTGPDQPMGERGAVKADTTPSDPRESS